MRILHVINGLTTGGAEAVLYRLVANSSGHEHEVICLEDRAWYSGRLEALGVKVHHMNWKSRGGVAAVARLHRLIGKSDADVVQTWMYRSNVFAGVSAWLLGKPVVWNIRCSTFDIYPLATRTLARVGGLLAPFVPRRIINCSAASARLHERVGYSSGLTVVIPNGFDASLIGPTDAAAALTKASLGFDPQTFVIGSVGRWHDQKGLRFLIAALPRLRSREIPFKLVLVGRELDEDNRELMALIRDAGCDDLVITMGERENVGDFARLFDLHVLASIGGEGFPNVVGETMLAGTPNVSTDVGDAALIMGDTGWTVPPGDSGLLAAAIERAYEEFATQPAKWRERGEATKSRIAELFSLKTMTRAYHRVWRDVVADAVTAKGEVPAASQAVESGAVAAGMPAPPPLSPVTFSVVIPVYNKENAIEATVQSVISQTRLPDELILVDDGSTDASVDVAQRILSAGPIKFRVISQPNCGVSLARNCGAAAAECDFVAFLDADDEWLPDCLAEFERLAQCCPEAGVLSVRLAKTTGAGPPLPERTGLPDQFFGEVRNPLEAYRRGYGLIHSSAVAVRPSALNAIGGFPPGAQMGEDIYCWLKLLMRERIAHSSRPLSIWHEEFTGIETRRGIIPFHISYFLGTPDGRQHLSHQALSRFIASNLAVQIAAWRLKRDEHVATELRRLSSALPLGRRAGALAAGWSPLWVLRRAVRFRRMRI